MAAELQTRDGFGEFLNTQGLTDSAVELGAYRGEFARTVLASWQGRQWFLVDPWDASPDFLLRHGGVPWDMITARRLCEVLASQDPRARLVQVGNPAAEAAVPPLLDAVYIDACHDTRSVWQDLETWWPRVRPGGLLAGHDYLDAWRWHDDINRGVLFGVRTAVDTFARSIGRVVASTAEEFPTWWFRKPIGQPERVAVVSGSTADVSYSNPRLPGRLPRPTGGRRNVGTDSEGTRSFSNPSNSLVDNRSRGQASYPRNRLCEMPTRRRNPLPGNEKALRRTRRRASRSG